MPSGCAVAGFAVFCAARPTAASNLSWYTTAGMGLYGLYVDGTGANPSGQYFVYLNHP